MILKESAVFHTITETNPLDLDPWQHCFSHQLYFSCFSQLVLILGASVSPSASACPFSPPTLWIYTAIQCIDTWHDWTPHHWFPSSIAVVNHAWLKICQGITVQRAESLQYFLAWKMQSRMMLWSCFVVYLLQVHLIDTDQYFSSLVKWHYVLQTIHALCSA